MMGEHPVVLLRQGKLKGKICEATKGRFYAYQGIPYAKPPVGQLRFRPPQPPDPWEGVRDAQTDGSSCSQINFITRQYEGDEDCLFLNVYTTQEPQARQAGKTAVMVWFHGGGFMSGSASSQVYGPEFLIEYGIVLVTVNYRVGILGFLTTEDDVCSGNYGLKDQVQALKWVQENIRAFGGDPSNVTIFGESAGGASVHYHILSPMSRGLFQHAISQSGTALCPWARTEKGRQRAFQMGEFLGFKAKTSEELIRFLRTVDPAKFYEVLPKYRDTPFVFDLLFVPVVESKVRKGDEAFLPHHPVTIIQRRLFNHVPWIVGVNSHEGLFTSIEFVRKREHLSRMGKEFETIAPKYFLYENTNSKEITKKIKKFYFGTRELGPELFDDFIDLDTDNKFMHGALRAAKLHLEAGSPPVYFYHLSYEGKNSLLKLMGASAKGVPHADDLFYMFHNDFMGEFEEGEVDSKVSKWFLNLWTTFAKAGDPTPKKAGDIGILWTPMTLGDQCYLDIGSQLTMKRNLCKERMAFWDSIVDLVEENIKSKL